MSGVGRKVQLRLGTLLVTVRGQVGFDEFLRSRGLTALETLDGRRVRFFNDLDPGHEYRLPASASVTPLVPAEPLFSEEHATPVLAGAPSHHVPTPPAAAAASQRRSCAYMLCELFVGDRSPLDIPIRLAFVALVLRTLCASITF